MHILVEGSDLSGLEKEAGGHRIQRVPPTERRGRVHTSTVTVAILDDTAGLRAQPIPDADLKIEWYSGTGAGGQHRNKHQNSCRITHIPTGTVVTAQTRSRLTSLAQARTAIEQSVGRRHEASSHALSSLSRRQQVGSGQRGDKIRTYRHQDDIVTDHVTGRRASVKQIMLGHFDLLW